MDDTTSLADDLSTAMGDTSTQSAVETVQATDATAAPLGTATTVQADATTAETSTDPAKKGPIPFDVHHTALENARQKAISEWDSQYGWAKQIPRDQLEAAMQFYGQFSGGDPIEALQHLAQRLQADPVHGPKLRSMAARTLAAARGQQGAGTGNNSGLDLNAVVVDLGNGQQFSLAEFRNQIRDEMRQEFAPVTQTVQTLQQREAAFQRQQQVSEFTTTTFDDVKTWAGMDSLENQKALGEALKVMRINGDDPREVALALNAAYRAVVIPKLQQARLADQVQQTNLKAQANTVSPHPATAGTPKSYDEMTTAEALRHELAGMKR